MRDENKWKMEDYIRVPLNTHVHVAAAVCRSYTISSIGHFPLTLFGIAPSVNRYKALYVTITGAFDHFCHEILMPSWISDWYVMPPSAEKLIVNWETEKLNFGWEQIYGVVCELRKHFEIDICYRADSLDILTNERLTRIMQLWRKALSFRVLTTEENTGCECRIPRHKGMSRLQSSGGRFKWVERSIGGFPLKASDASSSEGEIRRDRRSWMNGGSEKKKKSRSACFLGRWECARICARVCASTGMWVIQVKTAGIARSDQHSRSNPMSHRVAAIPPLLPTCHHLLLHSVSGSPLSFNLRFTPTWIESAWSSHAR